MRSVKVKPFTFVVAALAFVAIVLMVLMGAYYIRLAFDESHYHEKGSIAYTLFQNDEIKNMPTPGIVGEATFFTGAGDGMKSPSQAIIFRSSNKKKNLRKSIGNHLLGLGYRKIEEDFFKRGKIEYSIRFSATDKDALLKARVTRIDGRY